jgi:hypothetical protein
MATTNPTNRKDSTMNQTTTNDRAGLIRAYVRECGAAYTSSDRCRPQYSQTFDQFEADADRKGERYYVAIWMGDLRGEGFLRIPTHTVPAVNTWPVLAVVDWAYSVQGNNPMADKLDRSRRTMSVGDLVRVNHRVWLCAPIGWVELTWNEAGAWSSLSWRDRSFVPDFLRNEAE